MPSIKPISDLRNYTEVLKEVDSVSRVYLTRNGHGAYTIMSIEEADELDRLRAMFHLVSDLKAAEEEADREGWIEADEFEKEIVKLEEEEGDDANYIKDYITKAFGYVNYFH